VANAQNAATQADQADALYKTAVSEHQAMQRKYEEDMKKILSVITSFTGDH
jgi:hypothetical protein